MKIAEARIKVKVLRNLITQFDTCDAIIQAMKKSEKQGLVVLDNIYFQNVQERRKEILEKFDDLLK